MKNFSKNIFVWIIISLILLGLFNVFKNSQRDYSSVTYTYSTLLDKAQNGEIKSVEIQGNNIFGQTMDGIDFSTYAPRDPNLIETLNDNQVAINAKPEQSVPSPPSSCGMFPPQRNGSPIYCWAVVMSWFRSTKNLSEYISG